jgi:hypothetical protein
VPTIWQNLIVLRWPLGFGAAVILAGLLNGAAVQAQQSPELPAKSLTATEPVTAQELQFYKGKGPGRDNSYVERFEEDYTYLRNPANSTDFLDPLKFIPLDPGGNVYLTLNGEIRFRYDNTNWRNLGVASSATPSKKPGGLPTFTPETQADNNDLLKQRYELGADLHLGDHLRFYGELIHGQQTGHDVGPSIPGNQRNELGLVNGFGEVYGILDDAKTGLRAGRQEIFLGNYLQVRANISTNLPSPVFDGFRFYRDWGNARIDAFAANLVKYSNDVLQDYDISSVNLWGIYGSYDLPKLTLAGVPTKTSVDLFYLGWRSRPFGGGAGGGVYDDQALETGGKIIAATGGGFVASQDHRDTFGLRSYGDLGNNVDYDWQAAYQIGSYAAYTVSAFAFNTSGGYTFHDVPWKPRLGFHIDGASGGADKGERSLHTYQPMYPDTQYYVPNNEFTPTNFYDVAPRITVNPTDRIRAEYYYSFLWRYSTADAIYTGAPWPGGQGQNSYAVTALLPGRPIGRQSDLRVSWTITQHVLTLFELGVFWPGSALQTAGAHTTLFLDANLTFKF